MLADRTPAGVDDLAGSAAQPTVRKPAVSPFGMKQMSWLSGLSATSRPRRPASARTSDFSVTPSGKKDRLS